MTMSKLAPPPPPWQETHYAMDLEAILKIDLICSLFCMRVYWLSLGYGYLPPPPPPHAFAKL